jgi:hypothetical protein
VEFDESGPVLVVQILDAHIDADPDVSLHLPAVAEAVFGRHPPVPIRLVSKKRQALQPGSPLAQLYRFNLKFPNV